MVETISFWLDGLLRWVVREKGTRKRKKAHIERERGDVGSETGKLSLSPLVQLVDLVRVLANLVVSWSF